jgi:hypothetical protein
LDLQSLTDEIIKLLLTSPKTIKSKRPKEVLKARHTEKNLDVITDDGKHSFTLIIRQSTSISDNFTCGLLWHAAAGQKIMLTRYNGSDHPHANPLEDESFEFACHIHRATERYISIGRKPEHYAQPTTRYQNVDDALKCLMDDCNISWHAEPNKDNDSQGNLFQ